MDTLNEKPESWFVTGLVQGAGSFSFSRQEHRVALYFGIKLSSEDEPLLRRVQRFFGGAGRIYRVRPAASYYRVCRAGELLRVVAHFDLFPLQGAKHTSFSLWRQMVLLKQGPERPWDEIRLLAAELSLRPTSRRRRRA